MSHSSPLAKPAPRRLAQVYAMLLLAGTTIHLPSFAHDGFSTQPTEGTSTDISLSIVHGCDRNPVIAPERRVPNAESRDYRFRQPVQSRHPAC